jgi:hypothetical protein
MKQTGILQVQSSQRLRCEALLLLTDHTAAPLAPRNDGTHAVRFIDVVKFELPAIGPSQSDDHENCDDPPRTRGNAGEPESGTSN